jgi:hypothetical protein
MSSDVTPIVTSSELLPADGTFGRHCRSVSWGALFAGLIAAMAMQVLFMLLGAGLGFAMWSPRTDANPVAELGAGAVIVQGISAVFSLWFGGWVAGRFSPAGLRGTGWLHGFVVWCAATVAGVLVVSMGASTAVGDISKVVGGGLSMAGKPAASLADSAAAAAKDATKRSTDMVGSFVDEGAGNATTGTTPGTTARAKREVGLAVARYFNPALENDKAANRAALVKVLADHGNMTEADADKMVNEWTKSYDDLKADIAATKAQAEQKAREVADKAAKALAVFSLCTFVAFVIGAMAASCGGHQGACHARKLRATTVAVL